MLKDINNWKDAPLWNKKSIKKATLVWFKYMKKIKMLKNLSSSIKRKIVKFQNISSIKKKHKNEKVILCHGVFDVVHPGHLRHFLFAKSKADILVVSCTSDQYINKGIYRPHVPEKLRAFNLAVLEMIDYVIIDNAKNL